SVLPTRRALYYGGAWHASVGGREAPVTSPSTGESLGDAIDASAEDVERAVAAARKAFLLWRDTKPEERAKAIRKAAAILRDHAEELALIEALDTGNPLSVMLYDVPISADKIELFAVIVLR